MFYFFFEKKAVLIFKTFYQSVVRILAKHSRKVRYFFRHGAVFSYKLDVRQIIDAT